jgi:carbon-monoxide dehydrogenase medium subunit
VKAARYIRPASLDEALAKLAARGGEALVIAGGTDLLPEMRKTRYTGGGGGNGSQGSRTLVDIGLLEEITGVSEADGVIHVGGAATMATIAASPLLAEKAAVLVAAARTVGSPLVRNRATIGGNLATASPSADTAPALLALEAGVRLASAQGVREVPLSGFFTGYRHTELAETELITDILIPVPTQRSAGRFEKVGLRSADAISVVCVATVLEMDGARCLKARIALGAVAPVPVRALAVERALEGRDLGPGVVRECARLVHEHIAPIDDVRGSGEYRRQVAEAVVARTIMQASGTEDAD